MRLFRAILVSLSVLVLLASCTCKTKKVGPEVDNIPLAEEGSALGDIRFDFDRSEISPAAQRVLRQNAEYMQSSPRMQVEIEGHCDERGTSEYNLALGERRAESTKSFMRSLGIASSRMRTISYGEELPLDPSDTEAAWAKNRRAHFRVLSQ